MSGKSLSDNEQKNRGNCLIDSPEANLSRSVFQQTFGFKRSLEGFVAAQLEQFYSRRAVNLRNEILVANKKISLRLKSNERKMRKEEKV